MTLLQQLTGLAETKRHDEVFIRELAHVLCTKLHRLRKKSNFLMNLVHFFLQESVKPRKRHPGHLHHRKIIMFLNNANPFE